MNLIEFQSPPRHILLIKPSALGDIVHALPVLNLLKLRWPDAKISWLVASKFAGLLDRHPQLEDVIKFDRDYLSQSWWNPKALAALISFLGNLRAQHFDLVIDLQGLFRSGLTAWLACRQCVGFQNARELSWIFNTHHVEVDVNAHALDRYLQVAAALGCGDRPVEFHFATTDEDRAAVDALVPRDTDFAVLLPGTNWPTKRWPVEYFAALVEPLAQRHGLQTVVAGSAAESALAKQIVGSKIAAIDLTGKTNLRELVALLERAKIVIANDSGPMHIAAALERPLVTMFGPTNPTRTGPWGRNDSVIHLPIDCSPCYSRKCWHQSCLKFLGVDSVLRLVDEQLSSAENRARVCS